MAVEKPKGRPQAPVIDKLHHREELIQPVLQRCAGQYQGKGGLEGFDDPAGLGFPVFDALAFIEDDQVPGHPFDGQDIAQHLFVIADRKKLIARILGRTLLVASQHQADAAIAEASDLAAPLGFE